MSEKDWDSFYDELIKALSESLDIKKSSQKDFIKTKQKRMWKNVRVIEDNKGKKLGEVKLSRSKMVAMKSEKTDQKMYRVRGQGWLLETQKPGRMGAGRVLPMDDEQAHHWLKENGWTVLEPSSMEPVKYEAKADEKIYVVGGTPLSKQAALDLVTKESEGVQVIAEHTDVKVEGNPVRFRNGLDSSYALDYGDLDPIDVAEQEAAFEETEDLERSEAFETAGMSETMDDGAKIWSALQREGYEGATDERKKEVFQDFRREYVNSGHKYEEFFRSTPDERLDVVKERRQEFLNAGGSLEEWGSTSPDHHDKVIAEAKAKETSNNAEETASTESTLEVVEETYEAEFTAAP